MWREETMHAHPSGALAGLHAPTRDNSHLDSGQPDPLDPNLEAHQLVRCLTVPATQQILTDEGLAPDIASRMTAASRARSPVRILMARGKASSRAPLCLPLSND